MQNFGGQVMTERFIPKGIYTTPEAPVVRKAPIAELTPSASWGYAGGGPRFNRGGDIFMPEQARGETLTTPKPTSPDMVRAGLEAHFAAQGRDIKTVPFDELQTTRNIFELEFNKHFPKESIGGVPTEILVRGTKPQEYGPLLDRNILKEATAASADFASVAQNLKDLEGRVAAGLSHDAFQEQGEGIQRRLADLLNPMKFDIKDGKLIAPRAMSEAEKARHDAMHNALSQELGKLINVYRMRELHQRGEEDQEGSELDIKEIDFIQAHEDLDKLLEEADKGMKRADWDVEYERAYDRIDAFITSIDYSSPSMRKFISTIAAESLSDGRKMRGRDGNQVESPDRRGKEHYGYALEHAIEMIIGQGDVNPTGDYPQFGLYMSGNLDDLIQASRKYSEGFFSYLYNLRSKRVLSHTVFQNLKDRKNLVEIVTRSLDPGGMRFIEDQIAGVPQILAFYEKELGRLTGSNSYEGKGWVQFDDYRDIADKYVEKEVNNGDLNLRKQVRKWVRNEQGVWEGRAVEGATRKMRTWETRRAFNMARANTGATLRRQIWGFYGDNPDNIPDLVKSLEGGEQVTMLMAPLARLDNRYFSQPGSQMFLDNWMDRKIEEATRQGKRYSLKRGDQEYGLYGASVKSTVLLDTGVVDVKSSGWRNDLMFLRQKAYGMFSPEQSLDEYFNSIKSHHRDVLKNTTYKNRDYERDARTKHALGHDVEHEFQHDLDHHHIIEKQRLFLGVLARRGDLTPKQKTVLWNNISELLPSRIASLMPQFSMEEVVAVYGEAGAKEKWDQIQRKLFLAEHDRVQDDAEGLRWRKVTSQDGSERWQKGYDGYRERTLKDYIKKRNDDAEARGGGPWMDDSELAVVERWQQLGHEMSGQLASIVWPHTPFLDDIPRTAWENMGRNELDRLLINDHNDWQEAYGQITGLVGNPAIPASKLPEMFHKFVEHAKSPESLGEAQGRVESFVYTWCKMARKYKIDRLTADLRTAGPKRVATSMMQEFNLSSGISKNEEEIAGLLVSLANLEIISDDPAEADEKKHWTQLIRMMHELNASRKDVTVWNMYDFLALALFEMARKALDAVVPDEVVKT